jgi:tRNA A37 threonylcarbamoyladenosine dehydratase
LLTLAIEVRKIREKPAPHVAGKIEHYSPIHQVNQSYLSASINIIRLRHSQETHQYITYHLNISRFTMSDRWHSQGSAFTIGLITGSIVASMLLSFRKSPDGSTDTSRAPLQSSESKKPSSGKQLPDEIREEMLSRNSLYFANPDSDGGDQPTGMARIQSSSVLVVGLGGVGSHTAHMLARAGVRYLRLVDFDQVTLSSLNRHAVATLKDVGLPKATVLSNYLRQICPDENRLVLDPVVKMFTGDKEKDGTMLDDPPGGWDIVIDAIDDVPTKANLIAHFAKRGVRVISCMGAGGKADPTRVHISDLRSASRDPLATSVRQKLRLMGKKDAKESGDKITNGSGIAVGGWLSCIDDDTKVSVVYSSEKVVAKLANITEEQKEEGMHNFGAVDNMRVRVLPVVGTMPAIMGQTLAAMAVCELGGKPFSPVGAERVGRNVRHR